MSVNTVARTNTTITMRDPRAASGGAALDTADRVLALRAAGDLRTAEHELVKEFAANAGAAHRAVKWLHFVGQVRFV